MAHLRCAVVADIAPSRTYAGTRPPPPSTPPAIISIILARRVSDVISGPVTRARQKDDVEAKTVSGSLPGLPPPIFCSPRGKVAGKMTVSRFQNISKTSRSNYKGKKLARNWFANVISENQEAGRQ